MENLKYGVFVLYFGCFAAMFFGDEGASRIGQVLFWGTLLVHLAEFVWKREFFREIGGDQNQHFLGTMLYGLFYWKPLENQRRDG